MRICLTNIYGSEKAKYVGMVRELGGLVRE